MIIGRFVNIFPFTQGTPNPTGRVIDPEPEKIALLQNPDVPRWFSDVVISFPDSRVGAGFADDLESVRSNRKARFLT